MINKKLIIQRGFTLMETLVAIMVLTLAITGPLVIAEKGLQAALISKDQDTAFLLAQDAVEYVRYARDTNCLAAGSPAGGCPLTQWLLDSGAVGAATNLTTCVAAGGCNIDVVAGSQPVAATGLPIYYDPAKNIFTYQSGSASIFTRTVTITTPVCIGAVCNASEANVSVRVDWSDPIAHHVTVTEDIFDWQ